MKNILFSKASVFNKIVFSMLFIPALLAGFLLAKPVFASSFWASTSASLITPRASFANVVANGKIYVLGGDLGGPNPSNQIESYDPIADEWKAEVSTIEPRWGLAAAVVDGQLITVAAGSPVPSGSVTTESYNPETGFTQRKADMPNPGWGAAAVSVGNKMYVIGGFNWADGGQNYNREYDAVTDTWTMKESMFTRRSWLSAEVIDDKIYVLGGWNYNDSEDLPTLEAYDPATDTWESKASLPIGAKSIATAVFKGQLYAIGGLSGEGSNTHIFNQVFAYNPATDRWEEKDNFPIPIAGAGAEVIGNTLYVFGGITDGGVVRRTYYLGDKPVEPNEKPILMMPGQFEYDNTSFVAEGGVVENGLVLIKAKLISPVVDAVQLQVELRPVVEPFAGAANLTSDFISSGGTALVVASGLADNQYHWQARAVDSQGAASGWQEFGESGNVDCEIKSTISAKAAMLAKELINYPYLWGGKGWDYARKEFVSPEVVKTGYKYWNPVLKSFSNGIGVDCSGLVAWSYNRNFDPAKAFLENFIKYQGADGQYRYNTEPIQESQLKPGDVMFFDNFEADKNGDYVQDGHMDHVAMYVGESGGFDVAEAASQDLGIIKSLEYNLRRLPKFVAFKQVVLADKPPLKILTSSPIDLVVTDPDGLTITPTTTISSEQEYLNEIPGELYYSIYDIEPDGTPKTEIYSPKLKQGNYIIKPVKREDAPAGSVYGITVHSDAGSIVLADNIPIDDIPQNGYGVAVEESSIIETDINPPETSASVAGVLGANDWCTGNVKITLTAIDTESGVDSTKYSLDNGSTWLMYNTGDQITLEKEGVTNIVYYSIDSKGNKEAERVLVIKIDKTPPEAKISADPASKDLLVVGVDNLSSATVSKDSAGNYIIKDEAGHTTKLIFNKTYIGKVLTYAKLTGIQYDGGAVVKLPNSYFVYAWNLLVSPQMLIGQTIYVDNIYAIEALYNKKLDKTTTLLKQKGLVIKRQEFSGLKIIKLTTSNGVIGYEF